jgi:hypothetical protein
MYFWTMVGHVWIANWRQNGHCASANSTSRIGACGSPSTMPCCGIPCTVDVTSRTRATFRWSCGSEPLLEARTAASTTAAATPSNAARIVERRRMRLQPGRPAPR